MCNLSPDSGDKHHIKPPLLLASDVIASVIGNEASAQRQAARAFEDLLPTTCDVRVL